MLNLLLTILLLEGFITISVEVLMMRQLLPFFGGSVLMTSIIIGIFLLFLALGYWRGGRQKDNYFKQLNQNFILSLFWVGIGLSYAFIALSYFITTFYFHWPFLFSLFIYLLLVLAPIVYWLGQTIPLTTNLFNQQQRIGRISGQALFLSTLGSFLGALFTSLVLFQYLGVAWTVFFNSLLLFGVVLLLRPLSGLKFSQLVFLAIGLIAIFMLNVHTEHVAFNHTNNYGNYRVIEMNDFRKLMQINHSSSSQLTADLKAYPYIEFIRDLLFKQLNLKNKTIAVIGAGGFTLTAANTHNNHVTYVDVDPDIKVIAEKFFLKEAIKGGFVAQDARQFFQQTNQTFDVVVSDVYSHQATIPPALLSAEYFQSIHRHLKEEGLLIVNMIANPRFQDDYSRVVNNTIHTVFHHCAMVPLSWENALTNMIYICSKTKTDDEKIYRDNLNTATMDYFKTRHDFMKTELELKRKS